MYAVQRQKQQAGYARHMTALDKYQRLESTGLWRASPEVQRREVIVSFGNATLVLSDKSETALTHWSLAALKRLNPRQRPAIYTPDPNGIETLEIEEDLMIRSIEKVISAVSRKSPHPGRLRLTGLLASIALVVALVLFWVPGALINHAAAVVPDVTRQGLGQKLLDNIQRLSGRPCHSSDGNQSLAKLRHRLVPDLTRIVVLRSGVIETEHLPGGIVLINRALVEDFETPEVPAGYILAEAQRLAGTDPLKRLLRTLGPVATFRLLTSGQIPVAALETYAEDLLTAPRTDLDHEALLARFEQAKIRSTPFAYALDVSGETTLSLIEADPVQPADAKPVLTDGDWVSLQNICIE